MSQSVVGGRIVIQGCLEMVSTRSCVTKQAVSERDLILMLLCKQRCGVDTMPEKCSLPEIYSE